jgi:hypothetical protein
MAICSSLIAFSGADNVIQASRSISIHKKKTDSDEVLGQDSDGQSDFLPIRQCWQIFFFSLDTGLLSVGATLSGLLQSTSSGIIQAGAA